MKFYIIMRRRCNYEGFLVYVVATALAIDQTPTLRHRN
jgi:hypothetical protein